MGGQDIEHKLRFSEVCSFVLANMVILAFFDTIWLFLSEINYLGSEVNQHDH